CGDVHNVSIDHSAKRHQINGTTYKSTATVDCDEGYYIKNETPILGISTRTLTCAETGSWINMPTCIPKDCGTLENITIPNAVKRLDINGTTFTSIANVSCDAGFKDENKKSQTSGITSTFIRCSENGTWSKLPNCVRKDCGNISNLNVSHAQLLHQNNGTKYESTGEIVCDEGYYNQEVGQTTGTSTTNITCTHTGKWQNVSECIPK
ncbi:E-selectin-like, partial [Ruditapes philippinarum]|uniref:E-selectin-like n=1 Tax=Ruditapes philippinarum TaxID=129788 RepID=UPI00295B2448